MATLTPAHRPALDREALSGAVVRILHQGGPNKADLVLVDVGEGPFVLKDFGRKGPWTRLLGRLQIAREVAAYRWLDGVAGVPRFLGRPDPWSLAIEYVRGLRLADASGVDVPRVLEALRDLLDRVHGRGVVHNDLRSRENLLLDPSGGLHVVDFAGAVRLRPGSWLHRSLFSILAHTDEAAFLRWKERLAPETLDAGERDFLARFARRRALWPFNRKRRRDATP